MPETRNDELYRALKHNGYPDDFCREIAYRQMNTDFTATRMLGYLYRVTSPRAEDVVDEMLAILSDRKAWIEKKQSEKLRRQSAECTGKACNLWGVSSRKSRRNGLAFFSGFCYNQCSEKATKRNSSDRAHSERKRQVKAFCRIYREPVLELCTEEKKIHQGKFIS